MLRRILSIVAAALLAVASTSFVRAADVPLPPLAAIAAENTQPGFHKWLGAWGAVFIAPNYRREVTANITRITAETADITLVWSAVSPDNPAGTATVTGKVIDPRIIQFGFNTDIARHSVTLVMADEQVFVDWNWRLKKKVGGGLSAHAVRLPSQLAAKVN